MAARRTRTSLAKSSTTSSESALYAALEKSKLPWTSLEQLSLGDKARSAKKDIKSLVAAGRVIALGTVKRSQVYAAVRSGSPEALELSLATQAAKDLARVNRLVLLPLGSQQAPYAQVPTKLRGALMIQALQKMAQRKEAFLVKINKTTYAALSDNFRQLLGNAPRATRPESRANSRASKKSPPIDRANVLVAYRRLSQTQKSPNVMIAELVRETGAPLEPFKEWLLSECLAHRAIPLLGEPSRATPEELAAALPVDGQLHVYVRFLEEVSR